MRFLNLRDFLISNEKRLFIKTKGKILAWKKAVVILKKKSIIKIDYNQFIFGKTWFKSDPFVSVLHVDSNATLEVKGELTIRSGARVSVTKNASLIMGSGNFNHNFNLACFEKIEIGYGVSISENVTIRDSDNHSITNNNDQIITKPIKIGNHVWIGLNVIILKGVTIGDGAIIGAGSLVNKDIPERCLAVGTPAKVIRENVEWLR